MALQIHYGYDNTKRNPLKPAVLVVVALIAVLFLILYIQMNSRAYDPCSYAFDYNNNGKKGDYQDKTICLRMYYSGKEVTAPKKNTSVFRWWFW